MRITIGLCVLAVSASLVYATKRGGSFSFGDLYLNFATELLGIAATVLLIEVLFERRSQKAEARRTAKNGLNELDQAVWIWLGGRREADIDETIALLDLVDAKTPLAPGTSNLFLRLGSRAAHTLRVDKENVARNRDLKTGLTKLSELLSIRDPQSSFSPTEIAKILKEGVEAIGRAAGEKPYSSSIVQGDPHFDPDEEKQEWRQYG